ncbi:Uncharacterised protein [Klebsiella pneumoniae]|nr:Uncharacterised protein [Klebsiella pneumoniae]
MTDDKQMVKFPKLREGDGKAANAFGKRLEALPVGGRRVLPVCAPCGVVFGIFLL